MSDLSFLSDSEDDKAVDELLSQAMDQSVLEQVAAINCSGFTDSTLPTHLDIRFQKLKSFPSANPKSDKPSIQSQSHSAFSSVFKSSNEDKSISKPHFHVQKDSDEIGFPFDLEKNSADEEDSKEILKSGVGSSKDEIFPHSKNPNLEKGLVGNSEFGFCSEPSNSFDFYAEDEIFSFPKKFPAGKKSRELYLSSSFPSDSSTESLSPPQRSGCLWCSPKKSSRKKNKGNRGLNISLDWGGNDEILSDLNSLSRKAQQKLLKKAMMEEAKISREAEKIAKWAKQASARMEVSVIEDELSDNESLK